MEAEEAARFPLATVFLGGLCLVSVATLVVVILMYVKVNKLSAAQRPQPGQYPPMPQQPVQYPAGQPQPGQQPPAAPQPPPAQPQPGPQQP